MNNFRDKSPRCGLDIFSSGSKDENGFKCEFFSSNLKVFQKIIENNRALLRISQYLAKPYENFIDLNPIKNPSKIETMK